MRQRRISIVSSGTVAPPWREFHTGLMRDPGFENTEGPTDPVGLLLDVQRRRADVVVFHCREGTLGVTSHLFSEFPDLTILFLFDSGWASLHQRCPSARTALSPTADDLISTLRRAVEDPCANGWAHG